MLTRKETAVADVEGTLNEFKAFIDSIEEIGKCSICKNTVHRIGADLHKQPSDDLVCSYCESENKKRQHKIDIENKISEWFSELENETKIKSRFSIPERYHGSTLANFIGDLGGREKEWLSNSKENLLIQSPKAGNGKTHLSIAMLIEWIKSKRDKIALISAQVNEGAFSNTLVTPSAKFVNFASLMLEVKSSFDSKEETEQKVISKYCNYDILVIDDIGTEKYSEYVQAVIYTILNTRYEKMKPTIITTNLSSADMNSSYGSRILSRVASGVVITLDGKDMRLSGAK